MPSSHLILCHPLFPLPQSLPASESFPTSQLFAWGGQSTGVSALASFFPRNPRADLLQNGLVGSPCSPRDSQESSPTPQFKSINSSGHQFPWCWKRFRAGEGDDRGWDGGMASPTQWTWVWVNSRRWWWTGRPGVLQSMGSQRVGHDWAAELNWTASVVTWCSPCVSLCLCFLFLYRHKSSDEGPPQSSTTSFNLTYYICKDPIVLSQIWGSG